MKLHLPKGLRSAVLACMAVVSGLATTVGTGVVTGGVIAVTFGVPQAQADYTWQGGSGEMDADDWKNAENWGLESVAGNGPGTPGSNMWETIVINGGTEGVSFSGIGLEGWQPKLSLDSMATVEATINKFQGTTTISVNNGSHLTLTHQGGHFEATTINVGENSSYTLKVTANKNIGDMQVNLASQTATLNLASANEGTYTLTGNCTIVTTLAATESDKLFTRKLGTMQGATVSNLSCDFGADWTQTQTEITEENYMQFGGMYYISVDETGAYSVIYSTAAPLAACEWVGGNLSWGVGTTFSNDVVFGDGAPVEFKTADATVTLTSDVMAKSVSVADDIAVSIGGEYALSTDTISVGADATLRLATTGNSISTIELGSLATLSLAPGKEVALADVLGSATISGAETAIIEVSGEGSYLTGVGNKFNQFAVITVTDGAKVNADGTGTGWGTAGKKIIVSDGAILERTTGDDMFGWSSAQNISILSGGTLDLGATRATMDVADVINLDNGAIVGTSEDSRGSMDFFQGGGVFNASNGSEISAAIGGQQSGTITEFNVTADAVDGTAGLTISGVLKNRLSFRKTGAGTLLLTGANTYAGTATVEAGTLAIDGEGAIGKNISVLDGATLALGSGVTLTGTNLVEGTLAITDAVTLTGALTLGETTLLDLTDWIGGDDYQLFNIGEGGSILPSVVQVNGREGHYLIDATGALVESVNLSWLGGDFVWNADTEFEGGKAADNAILTFKGSAGDVDATLEGEVAFALVNVEAGTNLILGGEGSLNADSVNLAGTLTLAGAQVTVGSLVAEEGAAMVLDAGAEKQWQMSELPQTGENAVELPLTIASGSLYLTSGSQKTGEITVEDGAGLRIGGSSQISKITLNGDGGWTSDGTVINAALLKNSGGALTIGCAVELATDSTVQVDGNSLTIAGAVTGAVLTKTGNNTLILNGNVSNAGIVVNSGTLRWAGGQTSKNTLDCGSITINSGAIFHIEHSQSDNSGTDIVLNGGTVKSNDQDPSGLAGYQVFGELNVLAAGILEYNWNGAMHFNKVTGDAALEVKGGSEAGLTWFKEVKDYNGTVTFTEPTNHEIVVGSVKQSAGKSMTIDGAVTLQDFTKTGAGSFAVTGLATLKGNVGMNYEGALTLGGGVSLAADAVLMYTGGTNTLRIDALTEQVLVNIYELDVSGGVDLDLGIATTISKDLIKVTGLQNYEIVQASNGYWKLTSSDTQLVTDWDLNWGGAELASSPTELTTSSVTETIALAGNENYDKDGYVSIDATGGGEGVLIFGGTNGAENAAAFVSSEDIWIKVSSGSFQGLIGASRANNWLSSGATSVLNADTHLLVDGESTVVGHLIGGFLQECNNPVFNGNSYISVMNGQVTGNIAGSSATVDGDSYTSYHNGSTNVFIYVPLANTTNAAHLNTANDPTNVLAGGAIALVHSRTDRPARFELTGETNVTIDLSGYSGTSTFVKEIYGGNYTNRTSTECVSKITGDTNVTITAKDSVTFGQRVVGGSLIHAGTATLTGTASLTINGGKFTGDVVGGMYHTAASTGTAGDMVINISGGTYTGKIVGGSYLHASGTTATIGSTTLNLSGGTYSGTIYGGAYHNDASTSTTGDVKLNITGGTYSSAVIAGSYLATSGGNLTVGDTSITISAPVVAADVDSDTPKAPEIIGDLIGGHRINGTGTVAITAATGDSTITLAGGTVGNIYGGSYSVRNASSNIIQGKIVVDLQGGKVTGDVYAGGHQGGNTKLTSESTLVKMGSGVTLTEGKTISGGYGGLATSVVTGKRTLEFAGTQDRSGVTFKDFDVIKVTEAASTVTMGALEMTDAVTIGGAGTIKLGAASTLSGGVTVESALNLNGKSLTGAVTVAEDGALIAGAAGSAVAGALTLGDGSALDVSAGSIALGSSGLTLGQGIVLTNTTGELERGTYTLLTGVGSWNLTGSVHAGDVFASINGKSGDDIADYMLELVDGNLKLSVSFSRELSWAESNDIWADGAQFGATAEDIFVNGDNAMFGALTANETVTVNGPITANTVSITAGEGKSYTFTDGTNGTISTGDLSVGAGSAIFGAGTLQVNDLSKVTIAEGGVLDMSAYSTKDVFKKFSSIASGDGQVVLNGGSGFANSVAHRIDLRDISNSEITTSVDYKVNNDLAINGWRAGTLVLGGDFEVGGELRLETDAKVVVNGHALSANVLSMGHTSAGVEKLTLVSGSITTSHIANSAAGNHTFLMEGGTLELTGTEGVASGITTTITGGTLKSGDNSWSISGATVGGDAAGDVAIVTGTGTITLNGATLTATLDNSAGKLAVAGAIDITSAGYVTTTTPSEYSEAHNNGYVKTNTAFAVATTVGNLTVAEGTTWTVDGSADNVSYANGMVTLAGTDWGTKYYVTGADVTYSGIAKTNGEGEALTAVVLNGSGLTLDAALDGVAIEVTKEGQSVVDIASGITLDSSGVTSDATHQLKLHGAGTYALANGVGTLGAGVVLGDSSSWTGTVQITNVSTGNMSELLSGLTNGAGTVSVANLTGWFNTVDCAANIQLVNGEGTPAISINNGNADAVGGTQRYAVLSGTISGDGDIKYLGWNTHANRQVNYKFTGEVSGWTGSFINAGQQERTVNIIFEGDTEINASVLNQGNVETSKTVLTIGGASAVTMNGDVDVTNLVLEQATSFNGSVAVSNSITNNGGMTLSNDLTLAGQLGGTGNVTGTNLALQAAANTAGDITLTGALTLGTDSVASTLTAGALNITGGITFNALAESQITAGSLAADLGLNISDDLLLTQLSQSATKSLTLMTVGELGGHGILLNGASEYDSADGQYRYTVDIVDGAVTITSAANGLKWAGTEESNLWSEGDSWLGNTVPESDNSVVFDGAGCSEVIISGSVAIRNVTIDVDAANGATTGYEFVGTSPTDELHLSKNLSVNAGSLILGVNTVVDGRTEVVAGASLELIAGNLASQYGFDNAGELIITSGANSSLVSVAGGDLVNTGTITNAGMLQAGYGAPGAENTPNIINSGSIENIGVVGVDGDLNNTGSYVQTAGSLVVLGDVNNSTDGASRGDMDISGGMVDVRGSINNSADLTVSGDETTVSVGSLVNTDGTLSIESGSVTVGSEETPGTLDNSDGTIALGGESTTGSLTVNGDLGNTGGSISVAGGSDLTVNGDVDNTTGGSISVTGGSSLAVSGDLDNTAGDLSLSDSGTTAAIGGDLIMTDGTAKGTLTVGEGTELTVGGDLAASNVDLAFGGNVTVGGDVEIGTLNNNGIFTANGSADTEVHIGTLTNNGTLSVGKETEDGLAGGHLDIGTLSGEGSVNVGKDGSLTITSATTFTGQLNNLGTLTITTTTLDSAQESVGQTAGNIITEGLTVTDSATGYNGGSYQLGNVQTDTLTIDGISPDTTRMSLSSLDSRTEGGKIKLVLSDIEDGTVTDGSYHLIELDGAMAGSIAEEFDLSNYGYNADGDYDRTLATVQSDYMQALLKANKYVTFSDVAPTDGVALLSGGTTDVYASIIELSPELSVWNLNGTETMTEAGLTVLKDGKLVSDDILDNVQTVKVTGEQAIDLTGDITRVTLNNLTAAEGIATALTISGDGSADDSAAITTAADGFDGTLVLTQASADISGKVTTLQTGDDSAANLDLRDSVIEVTGTGVTLSGVVNKGSLNFGLGSDELGKEIIGGDLRLKNTAINVTQADNSIVIDGVGSGVNTIAFLGETSGSATVTLNGKGFDKYFSNARLEDGIVVADRNDSYVTDKLAPTSPNGAAGAELLDATLVYDNPQASREVMPDRAALLDAVDAGRVTDEELAAVAGASVATMGMALSGDVERQLRAIRNRTTSMGVNECVVNEGMPYFNAWVNAEGNRADLDKDGTLAGYTMDSWGGTVGFDVDFDPYFTAGMAITAMYGNLTANGPETKAEGDMDTYYVTLFARYAKSAWTHTFVGTIGMMDGTLDRTVSAGGRTYKTEGDTEGMSFGLMYEVGYVMPLDEDATACLQPIFNVMLRHAGVGSYTEKGSDAALEVDSQSMTTLTFGLGARLQAIVGESLYNRASIFEARALVKADVGDRSSETDVAFVGSSHASSVESAELGAIGVELGAGLTIPVGDDDGSIFIDGAVELRSGYTNVNGTVGYRINF